MSRWLLAMHSSSETLGLAVCDANDPARGTRILSRPMGRQLTNGLIPAVEELLPRAEFQAVDTRAMAANGCIPQVGWAPWSAGHQYSSLV